MIRTNLSTRPFYNQRVVHLWLLLLAVIVAAATVFNVARVIQYSTSNTELGSQASRDEAEAARLRTEATQLRSTVDAKQLATASEQAKLANSLIDRRTFSWTELFNQLEATLPDDVRITSVRPMVDEKRGISVSITIISKRVEDVDTFMQNLEATGAFAALNPAQDKPDEEGLLKTTIEAVYRPNAAAQGGAKRP